MNTSSDALTRIPMPGDVLLMARAGAPVTVGREIKKGGEGVLYEARLRDQPFAVKWRRPFDGIEVMQRHIDNLIGLPCPHKDFVWPMDLVVSENLPGFGYLMPLVDRGRFIDLRVMLRNSTPADVGSEPVFQLRSLTSIGRKIVEAFEALHGAGLCYRDISLGNVMVDPIRAEIAIIDNDNVGLAAERTFIAGTKGFMAPEIVRHDEDVYPSTATDLFSLAMLLFWLFIKRDPLRGIRAEAAGAWDNDRRVSETTVHMETYGFDPLFVFDPSDPSNRPPPGDVGYSLWSFYPTFFRRLFVQSFTDGLAPSLIGRVIEGRWRRALLRLADSISVCRCSAVVIYDSEEPGRPCWRCGDLPPNPMLLDLPGGTVVLSQGATITSHHLNKHSSHDEVVATAEIPTNTAVYAMTLRNQSATTWKVVPEGEGTRSVEPDHLLGVRPMSIDFGTARGQIRSAPDVVSA
jgi:eukaryotic-like serine/threonine-protein kinase